MMNKFIFKVLVVTSLVSCSSEKRDIVIEPVVAEDSRYEELKEISTSQFDTNIQIEALIHGDVSNSGRIIISVTGNADRFAFKLEPQETVNCSSSDGYKIIGSISNGINLKANDYPEGTLILCLLGGNSRTGKWSPYDNASGYTLNNIYSKNTDEDSETQDEKNPSEPAPKLSCYRQISNSSWVQSMEPDKEACRLKDSCKDGGGQQTNSCYKYAYSETDKAESWYSCYWLSNQSSKWIEYPSKKSENKCKEASSNCGNGGACFKWNAGNPKQ